MVRDMKFVYKLTEELPSIFVPSPVFTVIELERAVPDSSFMMYICPADTAAATGSVIVIPPAVHPM